MFVSSYLAQTKPNQTKPSIKSHHTSQDRPIETHLCSRSKGGCRSSKGEYSSNLDHFDVCLFVCFWRCLIRSKKLFHTQQTAGHTGQRQLTCIHHTEKIASLLARRSKRVRSYKQRFMTFRSFLKQEGKGSRAFGGWFWPLSPLSWKNQTKKLNHERRIISHEWYPSRIGIVRSTDPIDDWFCACVKMKGGGCLVVLLPYR